MTTLIAQGLLVSCLGVPSGLLALGIGWIEKDFRTRFIAGLITLGGLFVLCAIDVFFVVGVKSIDEEKPSQGDRSTYTR